MAICHNGKEGGLVSRRSFLKGGVAVGGAALVGGVLGGCSPQQSGSDAAPLSACRASGDVGRGVGCGNCWFWAARAQRRLGRR